MSTKIKMMGSLVMVTAATVALGGCVTLTTADPSAEKGTPTTSSKPAATTPAPTAAASDGGGQKTPETPVSDGGGESTDQTEESIDTGGKPTYLNANQAFSPELETWRIDGKTITYKKQNCLAQTKAEATGTLGKKSEDGVTPVVWKSTLTKKSKEDEKEEGNPFAMDGGEMSGLSAKLTIDDDSIGVKDLPEMNRATSEIDEEKSTFDSMCMEAGEAVGEFVFG